MMRQGSRARRGGRSGGARGACAWAESEPGLPAALKELGRLGRRGLRRPVVVLLAVALVTSAAAALAWRRPPIHKVQRILRVTETPSAHPTATRDVRGYVENVALTHERLLALVRKHHVTNLDLPGADPVAAVEDIRDSLSIEVVRNPAMALLPPAERPNATRVIVRYESPDPGEAIAVADDLVRTITGTEGKRSLWAIQSDERMAAAAVAAARRDLSRLRLALVQHGDQAQAAAAASDLTYLAAQTHAAQTKLTELEGRYAEAQIRTRMAEERVAMEFEVVPPAPMPSPLPRAVKTGLVAGLTSVFALPLCLVLVAAFDPRIYFEEDLASLGLAVLGHVPRFPAGAGEGGSGAAGRPGV